MGWINYSKNTYLKKYYWIYNQLTHNTVKHTNHNFQSRVMNNHKKFKGSYQLKKNHEIIQVSEYKYKHPQLTWIPFKSFNVIFTED